MRADPLNRPPPTNDDGAFVPSKGSSPLGTASSSAQEGVAHYATEIASTTKPVIITTAAAMRRSSVRSTAGTDGSGPVSAAPCRHRDRICARVVRDSSQRSASVERVVAGGEWRVGQPPKTRVCADRTAKYAV